MTCEFIPQIHLLHDGELSAVAQPAVQAHLAGCDACTAELAELQNISPRFALLASELGSEFSLSMIERARLDRVLDQQRAEQSADEAQWIEVARTARMLSALAASILVISSIWLFEIPSGHTTAISPVVVAVSPRDFSAPEGNDRIAAEMPAWERIASTLRVDPRPEDASSYEIGVADARSFNDNSPDGPVADWIIAGLGSHN